MRKQRKVSSFFLVNALPPDDAKTSFRNKQGAWLVFKGAKRRFWTVELEVQKDEVFGIWTIDEKKYYAVVDNLMPAEVESALATIGEKYSKTKFTRPIEFEGVSEL